MKERDPVSTIGVFYRWTVTRVHERYTSPQTSILLKDNILQMDGDSRELLKQVSDAFQQKWLNSDSSVVEWLKSDLQQPELGEQSNNPEKKEGKRKVKEELADEPTQPQPAHTDESKRQQRSDRQKTIGAKKEKGITGYLNAVDGGGCRRTSSDRQRWLQSRADEEGATARTRKLNGGNEKRKRVCTRGGQ